MPDPAVPVSLADLQSQLSEVEDEISAMTGAVDFSMGGMTIDEQGSYDRLVSQRADLQWRINNYNAGGGINDNCAAVSMSLE